MGLSNNYVIAGVQLTSKGKNVVNFGQVCAMFLSIFSFMAVKDKFGLCYGQTIEA